MDITVEGASHSSSRGIDSVPTVEPTIEAQQRAARIIQHAWLLHGRSVVLQKWICAYGDNYAAHAVWADNVYPLMMRGVVMPGEMQVAHEGKVSTETLYYGNRVVECFDFQELEKIKCERGRDQKYAMVKAVFLHFFTPCGRIPSPLSFAKIVAGLNGNLDQRLDTQKRGAMKKEYIKQWSPPRHIRKLVRVELPFSDFIVPWIEERRIERKGLIYEIGTRLKVSANIARILIDRHFVEHPIDKRLAKIYKKMNERTIVHFLDEEDDYRRIRGYDVPPDDYNIRYNIFAQYNDVDWKYGLIAIVVGNPLIKNSVSTLPIQKTDEVRFLSPWENGGDYFTIALKDLKVIIMGPESILGEYRDRYENIVTFEEMSLRQRRFFNVPQVRVGKNREESMCNWQFGKPNLAPLLPKAPRYKSL